MQILDNTKTFWNVNTHLPLQFNFTTEIQSKANFNVIKCRDFEMKEQMQLISAHYSLYICKMFQPSRRIDLISDYFDLHNLIGSLARY